MEKKEFFDALDGLKATLSKSTAEVVAEEIKNLETKLSEKDGEIEQKLQDALTELKDSLKIMQEQGDDLDAKIKSISITKGKAKEVDSIKSIITESFEEIKKARKGNKVRIEKKEMTLPGNLVGSQPRTYSNDVVIIPGQALNVEDLIQTINIDGGTYTYPREANPSGNVGWQPAPVDGGSGFEAQPKNELDMNLSMVDVTTDFLAGLTKYSKKMANNLPFLESFLPRALRREYYFAENSEFYGTIANESSQSQEVIAGQNKIEMILAEFATLESRNYMAKAVCMTPTDYYDILVTEKSTGAGYGLPGVVTIDGGVLRINGIPVVRANWLTANKYFVGDWNFVKKIQTQGLALEFSTDDRDNFSRNMISARIEAQVAVTVEAPLAMIHGDFTATKKKDDKKK